MHENENSIQCARSFRINISFFVVVVVLFVHDQSLGEKGMFFLSKMPESFLNFVMSCELTIQWSVSLRQPNVGGRRCTNW